MAEFNFYMDAATKAAKAERAGKYSFAAQLWESASYSALYKKNRDFAQARSEFCRKQHEVSAHA
ncbi:ANR family transcriptional regulator [Vibrio atlanticus]|uniref:ANR family transcriptional regulator n=1 Tax=Vibrio atlanticus TaxID=693153 RepID=UPI0035539CD9|nr:ANR family transcriptional regulator [Vibrio metschnikovii]